MSREIRRVAPDWKHPQEWVWSPLVPYTLRELGPEALRELRELEHVRRSFTSPSMEEYKHAVHVSMFDKSLEEAQAEWDARQAEHGDADEYQGKRPDPDAPRGYDRSTGYGPEFFRPNWSEEERTAFQIYETVSEGSPVSPVFETVEEMRAWLVESGHSEEAADAFIREGSVPTFVTFRDESGTDIREGIDALEPRT